MDASNNFIPDWSDPSKYGIWAWTQPGRSMAAVGAPAQTVAFGDSGHADGMGGVKATWDTLESPAARYYNGAQDWVSILEPRHNQTANITWLDGHVKTMKFEAVYGRWDQNKNFIPTQTPMDRYFNLSDQK